MKEIEKNVIDKSAVCVQQQVFLPLFFSRIDMASKMVHPENLIDLFDEILINIMFRLPMEDLCTLTAVCKRLRLLAFTVFKQQYAKHMVFADPVYQMYRTTRIIKCFGQFIQSITLDGSFVWDLDRTILQLIKQYCRSLRKLRLVRIHFDKTSAAIIKMLVVKLNVIELLYCTIEANQSRVTYNAALKDVDNLKEFVFIGGNTKDIDLKFLNKSWPEFKKLEILGPQVSQQMLAQVLKKNPGIKYFSYLPDKPTSAMVSWMKWFDRDILHNVQHLSIELTPGIGYSFLFKALTKLRRISINCSGYDRYPIPSLIEILSKIETLEVLSLWHVKFDEIQTIPVIDRLKTLELREVEAVEDRKTLADTIAKRWNNVENLYVDHSMVYSANDLGILIEDMVQLKNLYLCDVRSFSLLPTWGQYTTWCSKRHSPVQIFIDSRYLPPNHTNDPNQPVIFRAFNNRISQMVNVICGSSLN